MAAPQVRDVEILPTVEDVSKILTAKVRYEAAQKMPNKDEWNKKNFNLTPWGIAYNCSKAKYEKSVASYNKVKRKPNNPPSPKNATALKTLIIAVAIGWQELIDQLKRTLKNWEYTTRDLQYIAKSTWLDPHNAQEIANAVAACDVIDDMAVVERLEKAITNELTEAVEKHNTLNSKLFTKDEVLKDKVRDKMLEIVDEFLADLKEQDIKIKVDDVLFIGSNASYNYTKDSDIDLHILANAKAAEYTPEVAAALYSAYRSLFNKNLDIEFYDIPVEIFIETEDSTRVSNGVYSVKKNKWLKKPSQEEIPEYDKEALAELVDKWETKYKELANDIKADKLDDEKKVVKLLEDIYEKLRKKGISKGEYSIENLAFKELRNKGYLDQLKDFRNELVSKRLSLEEELAKCDWDNINNEIARAAYGNRPQFLSDSKTFYIYNLKQADAETALRRIQALPFVVEASTSDSGKYDYSNVLELAINKMPKKYYNIRGTINY